jgi:DNA-binding NtrC family response regulator
MERLMAAEWRGNVRELKNALESAAVMSRASLLGPEDFPPESLRAAPVLQHDYGQSGDTPLLAISDYREAKRQFEIAYVKAKLREHGGNITRTAAAIGIHRQSLQEKLRELGIQGEKD